MPRIDLDFLCHHLSITLGTRSISQKRRRLGEEKRKATKEETNKKCSLEVQARKFLGFMLTKRGIEANPEKCQTIIDMRNPRNIKEM
ncbi:hypothetical protein CR513_04487, partial [Mucuna pruriens]